LGRVNDRRARRDKILKIIHKRHSFTQRLLNLLAVGDVRPRTDDLKRLSGIPLDDLEGILDPDVVPISVSKAVFGCSSPSFNERTHLFEDSLGIFWMEALGPELAIFEHLPLREAHNGIDVLANKRTRITARALVRVHDARGDGVKVLQARASLLEFAGSLLDTFF